MRLARHPLSPASCFPSNTPPTRTSTFYQHPSLCHPVRLCAGICHAKRKCCRCLMSSVDFFLPLQVWLCVCVCQCLCVCQCVCVFFSPWPSTIVDDPRSCPFSSLTTSLVCPANCRHFHAQCVLPISTPPQSTTTLPPSLRPPCPSQLMRCLDGFVWPSVGSLG